MPLVKGDDTPFEEYAFNPHMEDLLQSLYPLTHADCVVYLAKPLYYYRRNFLEFPAMLSRVRSNGSSASLYMKQLACYMTILGYGLAARP
jgi:hypothetical protein